MLLTRSSASWSSRRGWASRRSCTRRSARVYGPQLHLLPADHRRWPAPGTELAEAMAAAMRTQMQAVGAHQGSRRCWTSPRAALGPYRGDVWRGSLPGRADGSGSCAGSRATTSRDGVVATAKHFVGYGASEGGMNWAPGSPASASCARSTCTRSRPRSDRGAALHDERLPRDRRHAVRGDRALLTELLRGEWGFDGLVVSDYFAVQKLDEYHRLADQRRGRGGVALEAGIDIELPSTDYYGAPLLEGGRGRARSARRRSTRRWGACFATKFELGLFERPFVASSEPPRSGYAGQRELARDDRAQEPRAPEERRRRCRCAPDTDDRRDRAERRQCAPPVGRLLATRRTSSRCWSCCEQPAHCRMPCPTRFELADHWRGDASGAGRDWRAVGPGGVRDAKGCDVLGELTRRASRKRWPPRAADLAILVVGDKAGLTDTARAANPRPRLLGLPGVQEQLVRAIVATGTPVVVVLVTGGRCASPGRRAFPAILWPGCQARRAATRGRCAVRRRQPRRQAADLLPARGRAAAGVLRPQAVGRALALEGRLCGLSLDAAVTLRPRAELHHASGYTDGTGRRGVRCERADRGRRRDHNTGDRAGDEVVQLYVRDPQASVTRPVLELKGFQRVALEPGAGDPALRGAGRPSSGSTTVSWSTWSSRARSISSSARHPARSSPPGWSRSRPPASPVEKAFDGTVRVT